jgi:hypothetical protein
MGVIMKRYIALLLGLGVLGFLIFGCDTIVEPEQTVLETGQAETVTDGDFGKKMVPFRGSGTYEFAGLDIVDGVVVLEVEIEGRATRLGRLEGFETMRFSYDPDGPDGLFGDYLSSSSTWIAANGDELHDEGSVEHGSVLQYHEPLGTGFSLTGVRIVGGTGRFENAVGWYDIWINHTPGGTSGTWELEGEISYGKMKPLRGGGTYEFAGLPDVIPEIIDGEEVLVLVAVVELEGRATRLGRFQGVETWRFRFDPHGPDGAFGDYLSHESTWIAANGDELHNEGSVEHGSVHEFHEPLGTGFSLTGVRIVGGTGRFENAVGWYDFWVNHNPDDGEPGGTWEFEGGISN